MNEDDMDPDMKLAHYLEIGAIELEGVDESGEMIFSITEKAKELLNKFNNSHDEENKRYIFHQNIDESKRCALIAVDEILDLDLHDVGDYRNDQASSDDFSTVTWYINYWEEVKQEIEQI